ncbi:hypothetical protein L195_g057316 [Trifolium pratense]|uniref:Uncharacterized protein n=1 Tax=Trifolium pratense TaxID=57577 RepID=A0A2K3KVQ0_TRIPR|nr:hypothetical protein L195_g057316 [Trifolium pratense]
MLPLSLVVRNREVHGDSRLRPMQPCQFILRWVLQYMPSMSVVYYYAIKSIEGGRRLVKLEHMSAGCGGLLRNSDGQWLGGFSRNLGRCSAYLAELWGFYHGFCLGRSQGRN